MRVRLRALERRAEQRFGLAREQIAGEISVVMAELDAWLQAHYAEAERLAWWRIYYALAVDVTAEQIAEHFGESGPEDQQIAERIDAAIPAELVERAKTLEARRVAYNNVSKEAI